MNPHRLLSLLLLLISSLLGAQTYHFQYIIKKGRLVIIPKFMYYWLCFNEDEGNTVAYSSVGSPLPHRLIPLLKEAKELPFSLYLHEVSVDATGLKKGDLSDEQLDYQPNNMTWPLMSSRLKSIISAHLTEKDKVRWISAHVVGKTMQATFYLPYFTEKMDVIDKKGSIYTRFSDTSIKPVFDSKKVQPFAVFHGDTMFWQITSRLYVNESIKRDIEKAKLTGIQFNRVKLS